ncbi:MAG: DUF2156 domain-containing protein [Clostridia bacterium]|nr:DUF2156 domain-containing protein [Clostridia bacterium]
MKTATLCDLPLFRRYFAREPRHLCLYFPGVLFMWRDYFRLAFCEEEETLTVRLAYDGVTDAYLPPIGRDPNGAMSRLCRRAREEGRPLHLIGLSEEECERIAAAYPGATLTHDRGESDYLYDAAALSTFAGKRYSGQRNHVNRFDRLYPDHRIERITPAHADRLSAFLSEFEALHATRPLFAEELTMTREVLYHYEEYGMTGVMLTVGDRVAAFACGEILGDMLAVHIEKADTRFSGAYQKIVSAFASTCEPTLTPLINREDDMNDEGLRTSKLSYHPLSILPKWRATICV